MSNPKIERVKEDIVKTKARISEYNAKLRELEKYKTDLENLEIIALYRKERFSDDEFSALLRAQRGEDSYGEQETMTSRQRSAKQAPSFDLKEDDNDNDQTED